MTKTRAHFMQLSAIGTGVAGVREAAEEAAKQRTYGRKTILFIGNVHRDDLNGSCMPGARLSTFSISSPPQTRSTTSTRHSKTHSFPMSSRYAYLFLYFF